MAAFSGYLLKDPNSGAVFPQRLIEARSYKSTPKQRQDLDSYQDANGNLHRTVVSHDRSKIVFSTYDLTLIDKMEIQTFLKNTMTNDRERQCYLQYWQDEDNIYDTGYFYIPDITFSIKFIDNTTIKYEPVEITLIEY